VSATPDTISTPSPPPVLLLEHSQCILSLAWSPNPPFTSRDPYVTQLASGCTAGLVHLWSVHPAALQGQAVRPLLSYRGHKRFVRSLSWSPDGCSIASGGDYGDNTVQVWNAETGRLLFTHSAQYRIFAAPFSPIAPLIASGSFDSSVQIWSAFNGERLQEYRGHQGPVYAVAWSPDGTRLVSAGQGTRAVVWSAESGKELLVYAGHQQAIKTVAWSPDGGAIATGGDDGTVQVWSVLDGQVRGVYRHPSWVRALSWSPDGILLASASGKRVYVWSLAPSRYPVVV
jgi:WD40 repeat protein